MSADTGPQTRETERWTVDPAASEVSFMVRGFWGIAPARGRLAVTSGQAGTVGREIVSGQLVIDAASVDTGNALRDRHLRGADFFDVERHGSIVFSLRPQPAVRGTLHGMARVKHTTVALALPVTTTNGTDVMKIHGALDVDRRAVGLDHSPLGMVRGPAHVEATITLRRAA